MSFSNNSSSSNILYPVYSALEEIISQEEAPSMIVDWPDEYLASFINIGTTKCDNFSVLVGFKGGLSASRCERWWKALHFFD